MRESCKQYIPDIVYNRTDKIGFYTPLISALDKDKNWVALQIENSKLLNQKYFKELLNKLYSNTLNMEQALQIWRCLSLNIWSQEYKINN